MNNICVEEEGDRIISEKQNEINSDWYMLM